MADMNTNKNTSTTAGSAGMSSANVKRDLSYDSKVIEKIAGIAAQEIPGILTLNGGLMGNITDRINTSDRSKGIDADVGKKQVALDLNVVVQYGYSVPDLFDQLETRVTQAVKEMTGLEVVECNMHVSDVMGKEEFQKTQANVTGADKQQSQTIHTNQTTAPAQSTPPPRVQ